MDKEAIVTGENERDEEKKDQEKLPDSPKVSSEYLLSCVNMLNTMQTCLRVNPLKMQLPDATI